MTSLSYLLDIRHDTGHSYLLSYLNIVLIMATAKRKVFPFTCNYICTYIIYIIDDVDIVNKK